MKVFSGTLVVLLFSIVHFQTAFGKWFENLERVSKNLDYTESPEIGEILDNLSLYCKPMEKLIDGTYYAKDNISQSPKSAQSRLCATVIEQHQPQINKFRTNMRSCSKFKGIMKNCCINFENLKKKDEKIAEKLCNDVPSHMNLINKVKQDRLDRKKLRENLSKESEWSLNKIFSYFGFSW